MRQTGIKNQLIHQSKRKDMFKKLFSKKASPLTARIEAMDKKALGNVTGGGEPIPGLDVALDPHPGGVANLHHIGVAGK